MALGRCRIFMLISYPVGCHLMVFQVKWLLVGVSALSYYKDQPHMHLTMWLISSHVTSECMISKCI